MAARATNVQVVHEVSVTRDDGVRICFQAVRYVHPNGLVEQGLRFIWRDRDGKLLPQRGQARIPALKLLKRLVAAAEDEGWAAGWAGEDAARFPS